jgi:hypothetical protein
MDVCDFRFVALEARHQTTLPTPQRASVPHPKKVPRSVLPM